MNSGKQSGTVLWFKTDKGFGFITPSDGGKDVFVHQSAIQAEGFRSLGEGMEVEFEVAQGDNGKLSAKNVTGPGGVKIIAPKRDGDGESKPEQRERNGSRERGSFKGPRKESMPFGDTQTMTSTQGQGQGHAQDCGGSGGWGSTSTNATLPTTVPSTNASAFGSWGK